MRCSSSLLNENFKPPSQKLILKVAHTVLFSNINSSCSILPSFELLHKAKKMFYQNIKTHMLICVLLSIYKPAQEKKKRANKESPRFLESALPGQSIPGLGHLCREADLRVTSTNLLLGFFENLFQNSLLY